MTDQPKPCPFCGYAEIGFHKAPFPGHDHFYCDECGAMSGYFTNSDIALAAWNRRVLPWISVAERLPEPEQLCLWWDARQVDEPDDPYVCALSRVASRAEFARQFTHWLPLSPDFFPAVEKLAQGEQGRDKTCQ